MNKLNTTIILSLILMLSGCAANTDEAPSATTATTATTTVATTTTAATTTQATTTSAQTTAVTEQSEPAETTAVTTTVATTTAATTTEPEPDQTEQAEPVKPEENTTPDGQYTLADSDLVNPDGTYTLDYNGGKDSVPECIVDTIPDDWYEKMPGLEQANPSKIPYSQITVENAHLAFPYTGWIGTSQATLREDTGSVAETGPDMSPGYIEILPTDSRETIEWKIRANTIGTDDTQFDYGQEIEDNCLYDRPHHFFASEADYKEFLAESQRLKEDYDRRSEQARLENESGNVDILGDLTEEEIEDIFNSRR